MRASAVIFGLAGETITPNEVAFFKEAQPWGFILFKRNISDAAGVRALTDALRESVGWRAPILIDQEGGRVARLAPPLATAWRAIGLWCECDWDEAARLEALTLRHHITAQELRALGIDVNCAPVADLRIPGADRIIGDRAFGDEPEAVGRRARAAMVGLARGGVVPVIKHLPGHGRALVDSHLVAPIVDAGVETLDLDCCAFEPLRDAPLGMTAHIVYSAIDPHQVATWSAPVIDQMIRRRIGFAGALMSDDLAMGALEGRMSARATRAFSAGCDLALHCSGVLDEMIAVAQAAPTLAGVSLARAARALAVRDNVQLIDAAEAKERLAVLGAPLIEV
jgi:beta-N-acetylhexosaminidase